MSGLWHPSDRIVNCSYGVAWVTRKSGYFGCVSTDLSLSLSLSLSLFLSVSVSLSVCVSGGSQST